jgi:PAS domain S-box-containing protein
MTTTPLSHSSAQKATAEAREARRLGALVDCAILDTPPEPSFDALAELAASVCDAPSGFVALVDRDRVWFKASHGLEMAELGRADSFCAHVITRAKVLVVQDACSDERFSRLPLVTGPLGVHFYAGAPVAAPGGERVGVVGVLDTRPRKLAPERRRALTLLARQAEGLLELRRLGRQAADASRLRLVFENSGEAILLTSIEGEIAAANPAACALFGRSEDELRALGREGVVDPTDERLAVGLAERRRTGQVRFELRLRRADGSAFPAEVTSVVFADAGGALMTSMNIRDLTQWHRAEQELRESEERFERLSDAAFEALAIHENGVILEANRAFSELFGLAPGDADGRGVLDFVHADSPEEVRRHIERGSDEVLEAAAIGPGGRRIIVETRARPVWVEGREARIVALHDVTERRQAEERLRESEHRLRLTIEEAHDVFVATDITGRIVEWNRAAERELGWTREEIVGQDAFSTFVLPERFEEFRAGLEALVATGESSLLSGRTEAEAKRKDGSRLPVEYTVWSVEVGGETLLNTFIHDIRDRKQAEETLRGLIDLFNGASDLIQLVEPDLRLQYVNPAWRAALGYVEEDVPGLSVLEIIAPDERDEYRAGLESVLAGSPRAVETTFVARDGRRIRVEGFESCRFDQHQPVSIRGFFRDVTQRNQLEEERELLFEAERRGAELLTEQNERLRQLDEMRDEFVSLVSHQVRTPLTTIRGYLELLLDGDAGSLTAEQQRFLGFVADGSQRLLELADDLLFISRVDAGKLKLSFEDVDLVSLAAAAVEALRPVGDERGVALAVEAEETPPVYVDPHAIRQAVDNLLSNGVKFTPEGGRVTLRVRPGDDAVLLEVADTGIGIPESEQSRLFERFFRASNVLSHAIPGTGLGLAIAKEIVDAHGGSVEFESAVGTGTTFRLMLPRNPSGRRTRKLGIRRPG